MFISSALAATANAPAQGGGVFPPFDTSTFASQLVWLVITFGLLYWLMSRVALPRVTEILETRKAHIEGDLEKAASAQKLADDAAAEYEKTMAEAKANAQSTIKDMRDKITAESDARRATLESELNAKLASAEAAIAKTKADAMGNVSGIAEDAAANIVQQLTGSKPDPAQVKSALEALKNG